MSEMTRGRFRANTAYHQMRVLHDNGLYRHLRFKHPTGGSFYWFDLVTWPGNLTINGDCGTYTFARITDMFEFFRSKYGINPQYWGEKIRSGKDPRAVTRSYSEDKLRQCMTDHIADRGAETEWPGLTADVESRFFGAKAEFDVAWEEEARRALDQYEFGATWDGTCKCGEERDGMTEEESWAWRRNHIASPHLHDLVKVDGYRFSDTYEWDLEDWDWQFLWCCHAIQFGIRQYDARRDQIEAAAYAEKTEREALVNA